MPASNICTRAKLRTSPRLSGNRDLYRLRAHALAARSLVSGQVLRHGLDVQGASMTLAS